jgi:hypothetical protein
MTKHTIIPPETDDEALARNWATRIWGPAGGSYLHCNTELYARQQHIKARRRAEERARQQADIYKAQLIHRAERLRALADDLERYLPDYRVRAIEHRSAPMREAAAAASMLLAASRTRRLQLQRRQLRRLADRFEQRALGVQPPAVIAPEPDYHPMGTIHIGPLRPVADRLELADAQA